MTIAVLSDLAKINPLFAPLAVLPCENDFLTSDIDDDDEEEIARERT